MQSSGRRPSRMRRISARMSWTRGDPEPNPDPIYRRADDSMPNGGGGGGGDGDQPREERTIRITVVGDGFTGKTCLLIGYKDKVFNDVYVPTVFDSYSMNIQIYERWYKLILQDTAGQEDYDRLRPLGYMTTDVFLICYSVDREDSYQNVINKWAKEVRHFRPNCKIILVGTKVDMRDTVRNSRTFDDGLRLQAQIRADDFLECSAKELFNVDAVFSAALMACVKKPKMKRRRERNCVIL